MKDGKMVVNLVPSDDKLNDYTGEYKQVEVVDQEGNTILVTYPVKKQPTNQIPKVIQDLRRLATSQVTNLNGRTMINTIPKG
jgi:hypothetical protein